jgi:hypothetical protein
VQATCNRKYTRRNALVMYLSVRATILNWWDMRFSRRCVWRRMMKMAVFWDISTCSLVDIKRRCGGSYYLRYQRYLLEAVPLKRLSIPYRNTRRNIPDDNHLDFWIVWYSSVMEFNRNFVRAMRVQNKTVTEFVYSWLNSLLSVLDHLIQLHLLHPTYLIWS